MSCSGALLNLGLHWNPCVVPLGWGQLQVCQEGVRGKWSHSHMARQWWPESNPGLSALGPSPGLWPGAWDAHGGADHAMPGSPSAEQLHCCFWARAATWWSLWRLRPGGFWKVICAREPGPPAAALSPSFLNVVTLCSGPITHPLQAVMCIVGPLSLEWKFWWVRG